MADIEKKSEDFEAKKKAYERRRAELTEHCKECMKLGGMPTVDQCNYGCTTGHLLRMLEVEYGKSVTGWSHESWVEHL